MAVIQRNRCKVPLAYDIGSVVYMHVQKMIAAMVRRAVRLGYDEIECESAANLAVAEAIKSFRDDLGDPVHWIKSHVNYALMDIKKRKATRSLPLASNPEHFIPVDPSSLEDDEPKFDLTTALMSLSDDAKCWVTLVLDPPEDILRTAARLGWSSDKPAGQEAAKYRQAVFQFLVDSGWSRRRATAALLEASSKLGGSK